MKVIIYINWKEEEVLTEKDYKEKIKEFKKDKENFDDYKSAYLNDYIENFIHESSYVSNFETVFNFTETERQKILDKIKKGYEIQVEEELSEEWEEVEIDI